MCSYGLMIWRWTVAPFHLSLPDTPISLLLSSHTCMAKPPRFSFQLNSVWFHQRQIWDIKGQKLLRRVHLVCSTMNAEACATKYMWSQHKETHTHFFRFSVQSFYSYTRVTVAFVTHLFPAVNAVTFIVNLIVNWSYSYLCGIFHETYFKCKILSRILWEVPLKKMFTWTFTHACTILNIQAGLRIGSVAV